MVDQYTPLHPHLYILQVGTDSGVKRWMYYEGMDINVQFQYGDDDDW